MGCNAKKDKKDLIRIVKTNEGVVTVDKTGKINGRGAYICNSLDCLEKVAKSKRLEKVLEIKIDEKIYDVLRGVLVDEAK